MVIIGEKINASLPAIKSLIRERDHDGLLNIARAQTDAGATHIDVNVGTGLGSRQDEISSMIWAIETMKQKMQTPISIDSADPAVLEAGLKTMNGKKGIINSARADDESLSNIVPLAVHYQTPLVALAMDEKGIPKTVEDRLAACEKIVSACLDQGLGLEDVYIDPLVIPISTDVKQASVTLQVLSNIKRSFPEVRTVMGLSNISYGLPERTQLNAAFLHMAVVAGLDAVIMDPLMNEMMGAVKVAEVLAGKDRHCRRYIRAFRNRKKPN